MLIGLSLALTQPRSAGGGGGGGGGVAPVNTVAPSISGTPTDGTAWTFNLGSWTGTVTQFEIRVRPIDGSPATYYPWTVVTADTTDTIVGAVGETLQLDVRATGTGGATATATSADFGPILAAGDTFVIGLALATAEQSLPSSPYPFIGIIGNNTKTATVKQGATVLSSGNSLYPITNPNTGMGALRFGFAGTTDISAGAVIDSNGFADNRLKGRIGSNAGLSATCIQIDLPSAGVYKIYAGLGVSSSATNVNFRILEGSVAGTQLYEMGPVNDVSNSANIVDAAGNTPTVVDWAAAAGPGMGAPIEITVAGPTSIFIGRRGVSGTSYLATIAVFKKA